MDDWVSAEMRTCDLGDARLNRRLGQLLQQTSDPVGESLPTACGGLSETIAAYRFFDHRRATAAAVLAPHAAATTERLGREPVGLLVQDTTELDFTGKDAITGLGPLNWPARRGLLCHLTLAVTPERRCLGVAAALMWARADGTGRVHRPRKQRTLSDKESQRWVAGYEQACELAAAAPSTRVISVADREGDIYEWYTTWAAAASPRADRVLRSCQDRALVGETARLRARLAQAPLLGRVRWTLPPRPGRRGRQVEQELRAATVTLRPPYRRGARLAPVTVNAVLAREVGVSAETTPVAWVLLTSLPVDRLAAAEQVVEYYRCRWQIEVFVRVWKSGCRVEALQLRDLARLEAALALYLIVAWRVLTVSSTARAHPEAPCTTLFSAAEWRALYTLKRRQAPKAPPPLGEFVRLLASLGGHLGRKSDGPPGPKSIWIGLQQLHCYCLAFAAFTALSAPKCV